MNAIQKFKEGRRIGKYQNPAGPLKPSNPWEEYYSQVYTPSGNAFAPTTQRTEAPARTGRANQGTTTFKERQRMVAQGAYNAQARAGLRNPAEDMVPIWQRKPAEPAVVKSAEPEEKPKGGTGGVSGRVNRRPRVDYATKFSGMNFTDEEKKYMTDAGFDPTNAKSVQEFILSKASGANLGARKGAGIADGYWGDKSAAAFQALRNQGIFTPKIDAQETPAPVVEQPVDAPDFGYRTDNHYGDGAALKNMGFSNYAGLQKFATGNDQFAKDLRQRFGQDISKWDQSTVEGALGVSGRYRGSRGGDFGDMARSMQQWAAQQNAAYDQKEIASRSDSQGNVYSNSKLAQLFDKAGKSLQAAKENQFAMKTPAFDFSLKQGNVGANLLGNQPGLIDQDQWAGTDGQA